LVFFSAPSPGLVADGFAPSACRFSGGTGSLFIPVAAIWVLDHHEIRHALRIADYAYPVNSGNHYM
jgi:hypothetical protein